MQANGLAGKPFKFTIGDFDGGGGEALVFDHDEQSAIVEHAATARKAYKPPTG